MENPFAKFFGGNNNQEKPEAPITVDGKPLSEYDDLPKGAEFVDEDCEGCACDDEYDDRGVIEKIAGKRHPGGTLAANAKLGELNRGYAKPGKGVKARRASKIILKK